MKIRQHEAMRVPQGWKGQDRALVIQLEHILDDIYRLFGIADTKMVTDIAYDPDTYKLTFTVDGLVHDVAPVAVLDGNGKIPASLLPSYVDDVEEYASASLFPGTGEEDKIYVAIDTGFTYRWSGTQYVRLNTYDLATQSASGLMSAEDKTKLDGVESGANNYSLPLAAANTRGGAKVGYTESGKNYAVQLSDEKMYVYVPWSDTTYSEATSADYGLVKTGYTENGKNYPVKLSSGQMYVNVPWTDHYAWADITGKPSTYSPSSHSHGNIQNGGTLQTNDVTIANGDKIVITDSSDSAKVARASVSFDGSTATQALTKKGTWETFNNYTHPTSSGNKHIPSGGSSGQFLGWSSDGTAKWVNNPNTDHYAWSDITGKPSTYPPSSHNHDSSYPPFIGSASISQVKQSNNASTTYATTASAWYWVVCYAIDGSHGIKIGSVDITYISSMLIPIKSGVTVTLKGTSGAGTFLYKVT